MWVYWKHFKSEQWVCVCACVCLCDKSGSILWSATEASVIGQAMSLLVLKDFAQQRGHRRVILPFVGWEIPQDSPHSSFLTKLLILSAGSCWHMIQLSDLWLLSIICTYIIIYYPQNKFLSRLALSDTAKVSGFHIRVVQQAANNTGL